MLLFTFLFFPLFLFFKIQVIGEEYDEAHKRKAVEALKGMEKWNLFSDTHEVYDWCNDNLHALSAISMFARYAS